MKATDAQKVLEDLVSAELKIGSTLYLGICTQIIGHVPAGLVLSELIYWYRPTSRGSSKLKVEKYDKETGSVRRYVAKTDRELRQKLGLSADQVKKAKKELKTLGLVSIKHHRFGRGNTTHYELHIDRLIELWHAARRDDQNGSIPAGRGDPRPNPAPSGTAETLVENPVDKSSISCGRVEADGGIAPPPLVGKPQSLGVVGFPQYQFRDSEITSSEITPTDETNHRKHNRLCKNRLCRLPFTGRILSELVRRSNRVCPKCGTALPASLIGEIDDIQKGSL